MFDETVCNEFPIDNNYFLWLTYTADKTTWYITSDRMRRSYQLWKGKKKTRWESDNPLSLYAHIK